MIGRRINMNGNYRDDILKRFLMEFYMSTRNHYKEGHPNDWVREASTNCWEETIKKSMTPIFGGLPSENIKWNKIK